jgi:hypothetical protein
MLTFFSTPKPFQGHINVIQRNALRSWQRVHPDAEILLFGDDKGASEVCAELGIRHVPGVRENRYGTKYLASIYDQAQELARHNLLCHVNCDILLLDDFRRSVERVAGASDPFLLAGRRWTLIFATRSGSKLRAGRTKCENWPSKRIVSGPHNGLITLSFVSGFSISKSPSLQSAGRVGTIGCFGTRCIPGLG